MADNVTLSAGTADGAIVATDDIGGVHYPIGKLAHGALDSATLVSTASGLPVQQQGTWNVTNVSGTVSLPTGASTETTLGTRLSESDFDTKSGSLTETAPATDTASSGLNGRLQRIAQRLTSIIALLPTALGAGGGLKVDGSGTALPVSLASVPSHAVTNAGTFAVQAADAGDVAHDGVDSGNPVKMGAQARSSEPTAVSTNADRVNLIADLVGKLIVLPYANPENFVSGTISSAMTGTTSTSLIAAPAAGLRNYITQITLSNASITVPTDVLIQDGSGGTTLYVLPAPCGTAGTGTGVAGGTFVFPTPLRQPTTATAIFVANVTTGSSVKASASGYIGR